MSIDPEAMTSSSAGVIHSTFGTHVPREAGIEKRRVRMCVLQEEDEVEGQARAQLFFDRDRRRIVAHELRVQLEGHNLSIRAKASDRGGEYGRIGRHAGRAAEDERATQSFIGHHSGAAFCMYGIVR